MASRRQAATATAAPVSGATAKSSRLSQSRPPPPPPPPLTPPADAAVAAGASTGGGYPSVADLWSGLSRLLRSAALRSFISESTPASPTRHGEGEHRWLSASVQAPTWCDLCGGFVWGRCMTCCHCLDCKYTCHAECKQLAARTSCGSICADRCMRDGSIGSGRTGARGSGSKLSRGDSGSHDADETDSGYSGSGQCSLQAAAAQSSLSASWDSRPAADVGPASAVSWFTRDELCKRIQQYNQRCGFAQFMTLPNKDNVFQGYVQVCLSIARPVQMSLSNRLPSLHDALRGQNGRPTSLNGAVTTTAVRLPKNAVVSLHVSSNDTVTVVIEMLLKKFKIMDNPYRFALYEQTVASDADVKIRRMDRAERPLLNYLAWRTDSYVQVPTPALLTAPPNADVSIKRLVLQEDNSGEIVWEAFSMPELLNFLRFLEKEERKRAEEIKVKYQTRRKLLESRLPRDKQLQQPAAASVSPATAAAPLSAVRRQKKR